MGFFSSVPTHVHNKHILCLEGLFTSRTALPAADESLFVALDVIIVDMFNEFILCTKFNVAIEPVTICLDKITRLILYICCIRCCAVIFIHWVPVSLTIIILANVDCSHSSFCPLSTLRNICWGAVRLYLSNIVRCRRRLLVWFLASYFMVPVQAALIRTTIFKTLQILGLVIFA